MLPQVHPHRPLVRSLVACQEVRRIGHQTTLVGLVEKVTAHAGSGHFASTLYGTLTSGQGQHLVQLQIGYFDTEGQETSRLTSSPRTIDLGMDPLHVFGLPIPLKVQQKGRGLIEFNVVIDGKVCETLQVSVR